MFAKCIADVQITWNLVNETVGLRENQYLGLSIQEST